MEGSRHGGMTARVETMLDELRASRDIRAAMAARMRRGEPIYGFGHPLYPNGDPRAVALMDLLRKRLPKSKELEFHERVIEAGEQLLEEKPTIDMALVAASRAMKLPRGSALTLFALATRRAFGELGWVRVSRAPAVATPTT